MINFWKKQKKPILALAPLAGYTDSAFRSICKDFGADLVYSEMASVAAIYYESDKTLDILKFKKKERPYIVQIFGREKDHFKKAVKVIERDIKPDGIDINFGCPVKKVLKQGAGAKLMADLKLSREIIKTVLANTSLPLSIKIRSEAFSVDSSTFLKNIEDLPVSALMIHARSLKQLFSGLINHDCIIKARNYFSGPILANGGINKFSDIAPILKKTKADGVGIARGALGKPWIFSPELENISKEEKKELALKTARKHLRAIKRNDLALREFRSHLAWYLKGFSGASALRAKIMKSESSLETEEILKLA